MGASRRTVMSAVRTCSAARLPLAPVSSVLFVHSAFLHFPQRKAPGCRPAHDSLTPPTIRAHQADDKFANYTPKIGILFPGQGAQSVGMAKVRPPLSLAWRQRRAQ